MNKFLLFLLLIPSLSHSQIINTIAGNGTAGYAGDGNPATMAKLNNPAAVIADMVGNVYIADYENNRIRKINAAGIISTIAGNGVAGYTGDGMQATAAQIYHPNGVLSDALGNIFFCDYSNHCVRKINASGIISTIAGTGIGGYGGDGGPATLAQLYYPTNIALDRTGNIYIADAANQRIRKINTTGNISTVAGTGTAGYTGDNIAATTAGLNNPYGVTVDALGNIYVGDQINDRVRKISTAGTITTIAGTGTAGYGGDGGAATAANLSRPTQVWADTSSGIIYFADRYNNCVRMISSSGIISTVAGNSIAGFSGDGGPATVAEANEIPGVSVDPFGNLYIADFNNNRIRKVSICIPTFTDQPVNDTVLPGNIAEFWISTLIPSPLFQWQQNAGGGYVNLANAWPYSSVYTDTLKIHNASMFIDTTHYRCIVTNGVACSDTSSAALLYIRDNTSVNEISADLVEIYPNPVFDNINIRLPVRNSHGLVQVINTIGQVILEQNVNETTILSLYTIPAGVYIIKVIYSGKVLHKKIIKR
jgi:hypothetical protein